MKSAKLILLLAIVTLWSCGPGKNEKGNTSGNVQTTLIIDKGFSEYISGYTSGVIPVNGAIEIRFTPDFAKTADKNKLSGLFSFDPSIKGKAEWKDDVTLVFRPAKLLESGKSWTGSLNLSKIGQVNSRLKSFPIAISTVKKDFSVVPGSLEFSAESDTYTLSGQVITSDYVNPDEVEAYIEAKIGGNNITLLWDHSTAENTHKFTLEKLARTDEDQTLTIFWDGSNYGMNQKASTTVMIPKKNSFVIQSVSVVAGEAQHIDIVFSDPVDASQETDGLIWFLPAMENTLKINSNIVSVYPSSVLQGKIDINIESSIKSTKGIALGSTHKESLEFTSIYPGIQPVGKGVILPASGSLIFPFMAANLKAVDLKIIKIFENNLPYFLQSNDLDEQGSIKRFGRPVYSGKVDLVSSASMNNGKWNLHTINLSDYITVEPGVLYR